jgi:hypothetical protein
MVAPEIRKVAADVAGKFVVAKVNTEEVPSLAQRYRVTAIPTMALFNNGLELARHQERRANFLSTPAYENKRCRCLAVYLELLLLKKYVEHIHLLF